KVGAVNADPGLVGFGEPDLAEDAPAVVEDPPTRGGAAERENPVQEVELPEKAGGVGREQEPGAHGVDGRSLLEQHVLKTATLGPGGPAVAQGASIREVPVRRTIEVRSPATGARLAEYPVADREAVAAAVARAREAQTRWAALGFAERGRILRRVRDRFVDEKD